MKDTPELNKRPSAPQTPIPVDPQIYCFPGPVNDFTMINQHTGLNPQHHINLPSQIPNVPPHMMSGNMGSPQMPPHLANSGFHGQANHMGPPPLAGQHHSPYWASGDAHVIHNVQMVNQFHGSPPQPPEGYMTMVHTISGQSPADHSQYGNQYQMHPLLFPNYMAPAHYSANREEVSQNQLVQNKFEAEDRFSLVQASKRLREGHKKLLKIHHDFAEERRTNPDKAAENPVVLEDITVVECHFFETLYKDVSSVEKQWLETRFPKVCLACQKLQHENGRGRPPRVMVSQTQLEEGNLVNTPQRNNGGAKNHHNPASYNANPNNPFKDPHANLSSQVGVSGPLSNVQKVIRQRPLGFQQSTQASGTPSGPSSVPIPSEVSNKLPGMNPSSFQQGVSQVSAFPSPPKSLSPTMDNEAVNPTAGKDSSLTALPNSAAQTLSHTSNSAIMRSPFASSVSVTPQLASGLESNSQSNVASDGHIPTQGLGSEASITTEGSSSTLQRKRAYDDDGDSPTSDSLAAKKSKFPTITDHELMAQTANGSQNPAETSMSDSARQVNQQHMEGLEITHDLRDPNYWRKLGLEPVHDLTDVEYREFLERDHPYIDFAKVWTYDQVRAGFDKHKDRFWRMFKNQFQADHHNTLKIYGLCPFYRGTLEFKDCDENQKQMYKNTAISQLLGLMLTRFHIEEGVFAQELQQLEESREKEEEEKRKKLRQEAKEELRKEKEEAARKKQEERRKIQEHLDRTPEEEEREEARKKKVLLGLAKTLVDQKDLRATYKHECAMLVGCDPIFQLPDQRTWIKMQIEKEESFKHLIDFERLTADDWEYINPSDPQPIRQRSIPPVNNMDELN